MLNSRLARILNWVLLVCCFLGVCVFIELNIDQLIDADISSDLVHAKLVSEQGNPFTSGWYYSTELRVVHVYLLFAPLFHLFEDWHTVRVLGSILWYLALLLSAYYVCRQCRMARVFPVVGIILMLPLSTPYYDNVIKGIFYVPYICSSLLVFGMALHCLHVNQRKKLALLLTIIGLFSFALSLSGMRMLLMLFIPLFLVALVNCWVQSKKRLKL